MDDNMYFLISNIFFGVLNVVSFTWNVYKQKIINKDK